MSRGGEPEVWSLRQDIIDLEYTIGGLRHQLVEAKAEIEDNRRTIAKLRDHLRAVLDDPHDAEAARNARRLVG